MTQVQSTARADMLTALRTFVLQRPNMRRSDYGSYASYRAESRAVTRDLHDALALLDVAQRSTGDMVPELIEQAARFTRLTWTGSDWEYATGQYFPTEFRRAAARLLANALFTHWYRSLRRADHLTTIQRHQHVVQVARRALGRSTANRYFGLAPAPSLLED